VIIEILKKRRVILVKKIRRYARELALNALYLTDTTEMAVDEALEVALDTDDQRAAALERSGGMPEVLDYATRLCRGVLDCWQELDGIIMGFAEDWAVNLQLPVDRNIIRIALYEIQFQDSVPSLVAVDEAIELAKRYSTAESSKFINGILAAYLRKQESDTSKS
jgi:N utilization substance protein B